MALSENTRQFIRGFGQEEYPRLSSEEIFSRTVGERTLKLIQTLGENHWFREGPTKGRISSPYSLQLPGLAHPTNVRFRAAFQTQTSKFHGQPRRNVLSVGASFVFHKFEKPPKGLHVTYTHLTPREFESNALPGDQREPITYYEQRAKYIGLLCYVEALEKGEIQERVPQEVLDLAGLNKPEL